ncbi:hypothetical protein CAAN1_11S04412 [[Candida] anglica]|uniref:Uncharacterized protein n=1 Tax=[Candida] anglica TaxID=148631 RepID=A0ABP0EMD2_9ASCO
MLCGVIATQFEQDLRHGMIVMIVSDDSNSGASDLEKLREYIEKDLGGEIKHVYNTVFYGVAVTWSELNKLYYHLSKLEQVDELDLDDVRLINKGIIQLVEKLGYPVEISADGLVGSNI